MYTYKLFIYNFNETIYLHKIFLKIIILLFYRFVSNFEPTQVGTYGIYQFIDIINLSNIYL